MAANSKGYSIGDDKMELEIRDKQGDFLDDLILSKRCAIWCKGKTQEENGIKFSWEDFAKRLES